MCGIVGYLGKGNAKEVVLNGLYKLEYRGYDSAGMSVFNEKNQRFDMYKDVGRVAHLDSLVQSIDHSPIAIGHTRWATHGKVNQANAHPHFSASERFVVVHNGVIENYRELKARYLNGHHWVSETDTEVIVQLIERFSDELSVEEAVKKTVSLLHGSYALLVLDQDNPERLIAAKHKSPLLIGKSDEGIIIASDLVALAKYSQVYSPLEDESIVVINQAEITLWNRDYVQQELTFQPMDFEDDLTELGEYPHYMLKEIMEQPLVMRKIVDRYFHDDHIVIDEAILEGIRQADRLYVLAAGTSMHAGYIGKRLFENLTEKPLEVHIASEFAYHPPVLSAQPFFILISQSGETADLRACLSHLKKHHYPSLTITNVKTSTLAREATYALELFAGPEIAVASTKAYTAQIAVLAVLAAKVAHRDAGLRESISELAAKMEQYLTQYESVAELVKRVLTKQNAFYIGRGTDYFVSLEAALKLKEISYIQAEGFAAGELKHGTIALIEEGTPVIALNSEPHVALNTRSNLEEVKSRGAMAVTIATEAVAQEGDDIVLPNVDPLLVPIMMVLPTQLIAYYAALERGHDIDKPRNLAKSVTVE